MFSAFFVPDGITCPRCKGKSVSTIAEHDQYDYNACRYQFPVTSGTIFHDSHLPLYEVYAALRSIQSSNDFMGKWIHDSVHEEVSAADLERLGA